MFHTYMYIYICFREHSQELDFSICKLDSKNDLQNVMIRMYIYIYRFGGSWIDFERPVLSVIFQRAFNFGPLWQTFRKFNTVPPFVLRTVKPCLLRCAVMHALIFFFATTVRHGSSLHCSQHWRRSLSINQVSSLPFTPLS